MGIEMKNEPEGQREELLMRGAIIEWANILNLISIFKTITLPYLEKASFDFYDLNFDY